MRSNSPLAYSGAGGILAGHARRRDRGRARRSDARAGTSSSSLRLAISASAKRPRIRSISRVPRCQQRNKSRLRRSSRPPLDRVDPVISCDSNANAKSPDVLPGGVDIASGPGNVSSVIRRYPCENGAVDCNPAFSSVIASAAKQSIGQHKEKNGLLRRFAPRNDGISRHTFAVSPRVSREVWPARSALCSWRAQGMPGARCAR